MIENVECIEERCRTCIFMVYIHFMQVNPEICKCMFVNKYTHKESVWYKHKTGKGSRLLLQYMNS